MRRFYPTQASLEWGTQDKKLWNSGAHGLQVHLTAGYGGGIG